MAANNDNNNVATWSLTIRPSDTFEVDEVILAPANQWAVPLGRTGLPYKDVGIIWPYYTETPSALVTLPKSCKLVFRVANGKCLPVMIVTGHQEFGMVTCRLTDFTGVMRPHSYPYDLFNMPFNFNAVEQNRDPWKEYLMKLQACHHLLIQETEFMMLYHKVDQDAHQLPKWDKPTWWPHGWLFRIQGTDSRYRVWRNSWCRSCKIERYDNPEFGLGMAVINIPGWNPGPGDWDCVNSANVTELELFDGNHHAVDELVLIQGLQPDILVTDHEDDSDSDSENGADDHDHDAGIDVAPGEILPEDVQFQIGNVDGHFDGSYEHSFNGEQEQEVAQAQVEAGQADHVAGLPNQFEALSIQIPGDFDHEVEDKPDQQEGACALPVNHAYYPLAWKLAVIEPLTKRKHGSNLGLHHAIARSINTWRGPSTPKSRQQSIAFASMCLRPSIPWPRQPLSHVAPVPLAPALIPGRVALESTTMSSNPGEISGIEPLPLSSEDISMRSASSLSSNTSNRRPLALNTGKMLADLSRASLTSIPETEASSGAQTVFDVSAYQFDGEATTSTLPEWENSDVSQSQLYQEASSDDAMAYDPEVFNIGATGDKSPARQERP